MKEAIILTAFGTSVQEAAKAYDGIEDEVRAEFPGIEIRWAFTSKKIRRKRALEGKDFPSPELVMARTMQDGFTHVSVMSLHVIPGIEFHELSRNVSLFGDMVGGIERVAVSRPLLSSHADCRRVARILAWRLGAALEDGEAILFMGHGTAKHPAYALYYALNAAFQDIDPRMYVGCVMGVPDLDETAPKVLASGVRKVLLVPLMAVAGDHARNDMAGEGPGSWKSKLEQEGLSCETHFKGIAEYPEIVDIWIDHLKEARRDLDT